MDTLIYQLARLCIRGIQFPSLEIVARLGRALGWLAFYLDGRHRRVAIQNLGRTWGSRWGEGRIRAIAHENFCRLGENYCCAIKTASMSASELKPHLEWVGTENLNGISEGTGNGSKVFAIGHFGNFELYARTDLWGVGKRTATTYRGLRQPGLDRLMRDLRERSGCLFFERRKDAEGLKKAMSSGGIYLGLLADQHAGDNGLWLPFFGMHCSTSAAPALFALRYHCPLHSAICYRVGLARWRIEFGPEIPTEVGGVRRSELEIMMDVNRTFELAIERDPANWFWVHKRWKPQKVRGSKPVAPSTQEPPPQIPGSSDPDDRPAVVS